MSKTEGYLVSLMRAGIEGFLHILCGMGSAQISFQRFLDQTGLFFDRYILDTSRQEGLSYIGGKMILRLDHGNTVVGTIPIQLSADLYFQTANKQWLVKQKQGQVDSPRFTDWDTDATAIALQQTGTLEWSIEPPNTGESV